MIKFFLLFPSSTYLTNRWWHRLATVIFWGWFIFAIGYFWKNIIIDPYISCIQAKISYEGLINKTSSMLDCGNNAFDYLYINIKSSTFADIVFGAVFFTGWIYLSLIAPSLTYRLLLYVTKGASWKKQDAGGV